MLGTAPTSSSELKPGALPGREGRQFRMVRGLALMLVLCAAPTLAAQDSGVTGDGQCRQIAGQLPHAASTFGHGLAAAPRNAIRPSHLKWELPIAAATGLLIASSDDQINRRISIALFREGRIAGIKPGPWDRTRNGRADVLGGLLRARLILYGKHGLRSSRSHGRCELDHLRGQSGRQPPIRLRSKHPRRVLGGRRVVSFGACRNKLRIRERYRPPLPESALA